MSLHSTVPDFTQPGLICAASKRPVRCSCRHGQAVLSAPTLSWDPLSKLTATRRSFGAAAAAKETEVPLTPPPVLSTQMSDVVASLRCVVVVVVVVVVDMEWRHAPKRATRRRRRAQACDGGQA